MGNQWVDRMLRELEANTPGVTADMSGSEVIEQAVRALRLATGADPAEAWRAGAEASQRVSPACGNCEGPLDAEWSCSRCNGLVTTPEACGRFAADGYRSAPKPWASEVYIVEQGTGALPAPVEGHDLLLYTESACAVVFTTWAPRMEWVADDGETPADCHNLGERWVMLGRRASQRESPVIAGQLGQVEMADPCAAVAAVDDLEDVEPGELIAPCGCPVCGAELEVVHGDEPGSVGVYGSNPRAQAGSALAEGLSGDLRRARLALDALVAALRPELARVIAGNAELETRLSDAMPDWYARVFGESQRKMTLLEEIEAAERQRPTRAGDVADLAERLADAFPLPADIVAAGRRLGLRVGRLGFNRTALETWAAILHSAQTGEGAAWRLSRPLTAADFDALLASREAERDRSFILRMNEAAGMALDAAPNRWRWIAVNAIALADEAGADATSVARLEAERDSLLAEETRR